DFAPVELLALVLVANDLIGRVDLGKARGSLRIVLVGVGMMLLGELAVGTLDRRSAGAPLHPQDLIGVAHPSRLLHGKSVLRLKGDSPPLFLHLGLQLHFCNSPRGSVLNRFRLHFTLGYWAVSLREPGFAGKRLG